MLIVRMARRWLCGIWRFLWSDSRRAFGLNFVILRKHHNLPVATITGNGSLSRSSGVKLYRHINLI